MNAKLSWLLVPSLLLAATGCPDVTVDSPEEDGIGAGGPIVEFDPGNKVIPFPNNLLLDPTTGKVNVPQACNESPASMATRVGVLNKLDGFGTYETVMTLTFSEAFDMASLMGKVVLYKRASGATPVEPSASNAIPVVLVPSMTQRFDADCANPEIVVQLIAVAARPLDQKSTYTAAILAGAKTATGDDFKPSFTWSLIRQETSPVTLDEDGNVTANNTPLSPTNAEDLATLQGLDLLFKAHKGAVDFLVAKSHARADILLAWEFNTQTTTDPLDPAVANSPAASVNTTPLTFLGSLSAGIDRVAPSPYAQCDALDSNAECYLKLALGSSACVQPACPASLIYTLGDATCASVGCEAVGNVVAGTFSSKQYMSEGTNAFDATKPIPGPWSDPLKPTMIKNENIQFIAMIPASPAPASGYPAVVYQHGLGSSKKTVFAIGPQLSAPQPALGFSSGFITIAIDAVAHDSRAVRISNDAAIGCGAASPDPTASPQCFAPFLSTNLATTRDGIRQTVLDLHGLVESMRACGVAGCTAAPLGIPAFPVDGAHISYLGISLGGIIGSAAVATKDFKAAVLNVPGVGWVDILEKTSTLGIKCPLVNGLIDAGILVGEKSNATFTTGLCTTDAWQAQPGYRQFSTIGRWILDSADPANFTQKLAAKRFMIQKVVDDAVVPNYATDNEAALTGLLSATVMATPAACAPQAGTFGPTPAVAAMATTTNKFVAYAPLPATANCPDALGAVQASPGTRYEHASLLRPSAGFCTTVTTNRCSAFSPTSAAITAVGNGQCNAQQAGDTCNGATVVQGQLATRRLQTDAITYLILNR